MPPESSAGLPQVSVLLVCYNSEHWLGPCLASIFGQTRQTPLEVVVVDNNSSDNSVALLQRDFPSVIVLRNNENVGFARAVNQAVRASSAGMVLLLNPDTLVLPDAVDSLVSFAMSHPEYGIVGGRTVDQFGILDPASCWALPSLWSLTTFATGLSTAFPRSPIFAPESLGRWQRDSVREVGMVTGCLLLTRRETWDELNGLDERFFVYGEDADFAFRARTEGIRSAVTPDAEIVHVKGTSTPNKADKLVLQLAGKVTFVTLNWHGVRSRLGLGLLISGVALRALGEKLLRRETGWGGAWRRRSDWVNGFPLTNYL